MAPKIIHLSADEIQQLRRQFESLPEVSDFKTNPKLAARIASYGLYREIGTPNDELARFIFNCETKQPVNPESLKAELIEWNNLFGVRVFSNESESLDLRTQSFFNVVHPTLSQNTDGTFHSLFIFPEIIADIAASEGVELVLVKQWGMNSIFGGFDPKKEYYQTNFWEIENNDVLKFADLTRKGQVAFMGTHDLIAHVAGVNRDEWNLLRQNAQKVYDAIQNYFQQTKKPSVSSLILPYTIGVVLDDLAQPPSYSSKGHTAVLNELILQLEKRTIPANLKTMLTQFPPSFRKIIETSRTPDINEEPQKIKASVQAMIKEILGASVAFG